MDSTFTAMVLKACGKIPRGKVSTYGRIARCIGSPRAGRAVGNALSKNPSPVTIPCHRVVRSDGLVGGYAGGQNKKIDLLRKEGITIRNGRIAGLEKVLIRTGGLK